MEGLLDNIIIWGGAACAAWLFTQFIRRIDR